MGWTGKGGREKMPLACVVDGNERAYVKLVWGACSHTAVRSCQHDRRHLSSVSDVHDDIARPKIFPVLSS